MQGLAWPETAPEVAEVEDLGYPTTTECDPEFPCLTQRPVLPTLDGVALPATWSRLRGGLSEALAELWRCHGGAERDQPPHWVALHQGRIFVNAHAFERLCAAVADTDPDPSLVAPPEGWIDQARSWWDRRRMRSARLDCLARLERAQEHASSVLERALRLDLSLVDTAELARGVLDHTVWFELMLLWLASQVSRLTGVPLWSAGGAARSSAVAEFESEAHAEVSAQDEPEGPAPDFDTHIQRALRLEQLCAAELGRRFVQLHICESPADIAYLTIEERCAAVHESARVAERVAERRARVESFAKVEVPERISTI